MHRILSKAPTQRVRPIFTLLLSILICLSPCYAADGDLTEYTHQNYKGDLVNLGIWHRDYQNRCHFLSYSHSPDNTTLLTLMELLQGEHELASYLLERAQEMKTGICLDDRDSGAFGYYDYHFNIIVLSEDLTLYEKLVILVHELRHVDHISRGYCQTIAYDMNEVVRLTFAAEADAQAITALFAWRLLNDQPEVWTALLNFQRYRDLAEVFEHQMLEHDNELQALLHTFMQWYQSDWRLSMYRASSCMNYLDTLDESHKLATFTKFPDDYFDNFCILPGGNNYGCHLTDEIWRYTSD